MGRWRSCVYLHAPRPPGAPRSITLGPGGEKKIDVAASPARCTCSSAPTPAACATANAARAIWSSGDGSGESCSTRRASSTPLQRLKALSTAPRVDIEPSPATAGFKTFPVGTAEEHVLRVQFRSRTDASADLVGKRRTEREFATAIGTGVPAIRISIENSNFQLLNFVAPRRTPHEGAPDGRAWSVPSTYRVATLAQRPPSSISAIPVAGTADVISTAPSERRSGKNSGNNSTSMAAIRRFWWRSLEARIPRCCFPCCTTCSVSGPT